MSYTPYNQVDLLLDGGFSKNQTNWIMKNLDPNFIDNLIEACWCQTTKVDVNELFQRALISKGQYGFNKGDVNEMILEKTPIYDQLWQLLYLAHCQVNKFEFKAKRFNLIWKSKSIIVFIMDNIGDIKKIIDTTTPEWEWIMTREYRTMTDLTTIVAEYGDEEEDLLPDPITLYRCLEQGHTPHKSLLPQNKDA